MLSNNAKEMEADNFAAVAEELMKKVRQGLSFIDGRRVGHARFRKGPVLVNQSSSETMVLNCQPLQCLPPMAPGEGRCTEWRSSLSSESPAMKRRLEECHCGKKR